MFQPGIFYYLYSSLAYSLPDGEIIPNTIAKLELGVPGVWGY